MKIRVMNSKTYSGDGYYIGRPSILCNPYVEGSDGSRKEVIEKYRQWLWRKMKEGGQVFNEMLKLMNIAIEGDLVLICHCKPLACHGDVLAKALNYLIHETEL